MIREILGDAVALIVFTLGGALSALALLKTSNRAKGVRAHSLDIGLGLLGGAVFLLLTEISFGGVIEEYTVFSFIVGYSGIIAFFSESKKVKTSSKVGLAIRSLLARKKAKTQPAKKQK